MSNPVSAEGYPVELQAPDIEAHREGNVGIDFVSSFAATESGPHVMLNAVTHGNEICGAIVLDRLLRDGLRPRRGRLSFAFVNCMAFSSYSAEAPDASRFVDEDFNRVWVEARLDGPEKTAELERARALRPWFDTVDLLLDIHSMSTRSKPLMICNGLEKERLFARKVDYPGHIMCGSGHVVGKRLIEYTPFHDTANAKVGLLVECGQHWAQATGQIAMDTACKFLLASGAVDDADVAPYLSAEARTASPAEMWDVVDGVTAETDAFEFTQRFEGMEIIERAGTVIAHDGGRPITTPHDHCLIMMPNHRQGAGTRKMRLCKRVG